MIGDELPKEDHVVRYVKPSLVDNETVDGSAFLLRPGEDGLSVNWLEILDSNCPTAQMDEVRRLSRITLSGNGRFAKLNVGHTKRYVLEGAEVEGITAVLRMSHSPLPGTEEFEADPSHAEVTGVPPNNGNSDVAMFVGDLIAECVSFPLYPGTIR